MKRGFLFLFILCISSLVSGQKDRYYGKQTEADKWRGALRKERTCFDVRFYHLDIQEIRFDQKSIRGSVRMQADIVEKTKRIQLDLFPEMQIESIRMNQGPLSYKRIYGAILIDLDRVYMPGEKIEIEIAYGGQPKIAVNAPWDGGFTWTKDEYGRPWMAVSCQGIGASLWWPNKDHLSDEPDSMRISVVQLSDSLWSVSNGTFLGQRKVNEKTINDFKVSYPINNYNVSLYVGHYSYFEEMTMQGEEELGLGYLVIEGNEKKAKKHFEMVPEMLDCFHTYFGPYPFQKDGFSLVEAPFAGMEHQSAIAYGNQYQKGYLGNDYSGIGLDFDFIIVHEAGHEYWGNHVSVKDISDLWIHEGFCTYAEVLYVECVYGKEKALDYIHFKRNMVMHNAPLISPANRNVQPTADIYTKGALFLHTLKSIPEKEEVFLEVLKSIQQKFGGKTISTQDILQSFSMAYKRDLSPIFDAYLRQVELPQIDYSIVQRDGKNFVKARWVNVGKKFAMPAYYTYGDKKRKVELRTVWKYFDLGPHNSVQWDDRKQYIKINKE